jgi:hypothetical protein
MKRTVSILVLAVGCAHDASTARRDPTLADVVRVLGETTPAFQDCYQRALTKNPPLASVSDITMRFSLGPSGRAANVSVAPHIDEEAERCMVDAISRALFPRLDRETSFVQPINLVVRQR